MVSYDGFEPIPPEQAIYLLTENNDIVSLYSNVSGPPSSNSRILGTPRTIRSQDIISNIAIVGYDEWKEEDRVCLVRFSMDHAKHLLTHDTKTKRLAKQDDDVVDSCDLELYSEVVGNVVFRAGYTAHYSSEYGGILREALPQLEVEFIDGTTLHSYIRTVLAYVYFFAFSLGRHLHPSTIFISRVSKDEMLRLAHDASYVGDHEVNYVWPDIKTDEAVGSIRDSPVCAWDDDQLLALRQCLQHWMARVDKWWNAYQLMMGSIKLKEEMSANRLINAFKWFEEIPLTKQNIAINEGDFKLMVDAEMTKADELRHPPALRKRIEGALKSIKTETNEDRFVRLVEAVRAKFGQKVLGAKIVADLMGAMSLRGKCAHGAFRAGRRCGISGICASGEGT